MLNSTQEQILIKAIRIRLNQGDNIYDILKNYTNLTLEDKGMILSHFSYSLNQLSVEEIKELKITELSNICREKIEYGVTLNINGIDEYFPYNLNKGDQEKIKSLFDTAKETRLAVPYHCSDGNCKLYTATQVFEIYEAIQVNQLKQETYFNQIKQYIKNTFSSPEDIPTILSIQYGDEIKNEYLANYNAMIEQGKLVIAARIPQN